MLAQMLSSKSNNEKSNTKNVKGNSSVNKKQTRVSSAAKVNTKISNINNAIYDADKIITLKSGAIYILDQNNLVKAFRLPGKPIRLLTEQQGIKFNERINEHITSRNLNNINDDKSATQEHKQSASVDSHTNDTTTPPKSSRAYECQVDNVSGKHHVSHDAQAHTTLSYDYNNNESNLLNAGSSQQEQQTSSLDYILKEDKEIAEKVGINLHHKIHRPSRQLIQNAPKPKKFSSSRAFETTNSKNNNTRGR